MSIENRTEADAVADLATTAARRTELLLPDVHAVVSTVTRDGETQDLDSLERFAQEPRRQRGSIRVTDIPSFLTLVRRHSLEDDSVIVADETRSAVTAVHNYVGGWGDHRAILGLTYSPEWQHWAGSNTKLVTQTAFAEHLEDGITSIISPDSADLMEIAATFQAKRSLTVESGARLRSGDVKFVYHEETKAGAGVKGDLEIPEKIVLRLPIYKGGDVVTISALLRYRITQDGLRIGYKLEQLADILTLGFAAVVDQVRAGAGAVPVLLGSAPDVVAPL